MLDFLHVPTLFGRDGVGLRVFADAGRPRNGRAERHDLDDDDLEVLLEDIEDLEDTNRSRPRDDLDLEEALLLGR